jgi:hypothetical protein
MYENGKMRPAEIVPGMGEGRIKENEGGGEFEYDIKNFIIYPQYSNNKKKIKN